MFEKIESSQQGRTNVAKAETEQRIAVVGFHEFASAQLLLGAGAYAIVKTKKGDIYGDYRSGRTKRRDTREIP